MQRSRGWSSARRESQQAHWLLWLPGLSCYAVMPIPVCSLLLCMRLPIPIHPSGPSPHLHILAAAQVLLRVR